MEIHKCPDCGRPHRVMKFDKTEQARRAAQKRWSVLMAPASIDGKLKAVVKKKQARIVGKPSAGEMCPHGREYGHCIIQICKDAFELGLGVVKE